MRSKSCSTASYEERKANCREGDVGRGGSCVGAEVEAEVEAEAVAEVRLLRG